MPSLGDNSFVKKYVAAYREMCRIRAFEEEAIRGLGANLVLGAIHPAIGQEAIAVGVCANLNRDDVLLSTHRGHAHTMAKGADSLAMMRELFGREGGTCGGKGGSMHIADFSVGMLGANGVVAANINIAVGAAHAIKMKKQQRIAVCMFGDGAINRGPFLEGLNWAGVYNLPILFVCEDNGYAATTRTSKVTSGPGAAARSEAIGVPAVSVDGNDIVAVDEAAARLVEAAKTEGPQMLVAQTYRLTGHTAVDPAAYRPKEEVEARWKEDPLTRCRVMLEARGVSARDLDADLAAARREMANAYRVAEQTGWPAVELAYADVQDVGDPARRAF